MTEAYHYSREVPSFSFPVDAGTPQGAHFQVRPLTFDLCSARPHHQLLGYGFSPRVVIHMLQQQNNRNILSIMDTLGGQLKVSWFKEVSRGSFCTLLYVTGTILSVLIKYRRCPYFKSGVFF